MIGFPPPQFFDKLGTLCQEATTMKKKLQLFICFISTIVCSISFLSWLPGILLNKVDRLSLLAAGVMLPDGKIFEEKGDCQVSNIVSTINFGQKNTVLASNTTDETVDNFLKNVPTFELSHNTNEPTYKILECMFGASGTKYQNFFINNKTSFDINVEETLKLPPDVSVKKDGTPQVLIVHTHTSEAYMDKDQGFYYQDFSARTTDPKFNVVQVGNAICQSLENCGIKTVHDTTIHDTPTFSGSYKRAAETIDKNLKKYPSISVVLDIHRDTIENKERQKIKPTCSINGKKAAQVMIIAGCDTDGTLEHPDWQYNLRLALRLQRQIESMYPGMTRSLLFKNARYNMHKTHGSLLIEVGSDANTLNEAVLSGLYLGKALAATLDGLS